jgi:asparagine N-glycosylation enzyme membrane subunit Stt3
LKAGHQAQSDKIPDCEKGPRPILSRRRAEQTQTTEKLMLQTIAIVLIILWLLGYVTAYTMGGFIHVLLVVAIILILVRIISGRKPL